MKTVREVLFIGDAFDDTELFSTRLQQRITSTLSLFFDYIFPHFFNGTYSFAFATLLRYSRFDSLFTFMSFVIRDYVVGNKFHVLSTSVYGYF